MIKLAEVKVSEKGVINLPSDMCLPYDTIKITVHNTTIPKFVAESGKCIFCGNEKHIRSSNGFSICKSCFTAFINDEFICEISEEIPLKYDQEVVLSNSIIAKSGIEEDEVVLAIYFSIDNELKIYRKLKQDFEDSKNYYDISSWIIDYATLKNIMNAWNDYN